jgi:hypothetical protein
MCRFIHSRHHDIMGHPIMAPRFGLSVAAPTPVHQTHLLIRIQLKTTLRLDATSIGTLSREARHINMVDPSRADSRNSSRKYPTIRDM